LDPLGVLAVWVGTGTTDLRLRLPRAVARLTGSERAALRLALVTSIGIAALVVDPSGMPAPGDPRLRPDSDLAVLQLVVASIAQR
jgi:hypothetical protein